MTPNVTTVQPKPEANAREAHEPEPPPQKHFAGIGEGFTFTGHAHPGQPNKTGLGDNDTALTISTERATKCEGLEEVAVNTESLQPFFAAFPRMNESKPEAQPTAT
jgi:hypothetical protein